MSSEKSSPKVEFIIKDPGVSDCSFTILICGDSRVGKKSLVKVAKGEIFSEEYKALVGHAYFSLGVKKDNAIIKFNIWDIYSNETDKKFMIDFFKNYSLIILVYDVTDRKTFENIDTWIEYVKSIREKGKIILIGNKSDLEGKREVTEEEGKKKCESNHLTEFMECSCKNGINVKEIFFNAAKILYDPNNLNLENENNSDSEEDKSASSSNNSEDDSFIREIYKIKKKSCPCCPFSCC